GSQQAYEEAYDRLFTAMDWLEQRLTDRRFLMGQHITEADVRLFTTLVRFDAAYHGHFKCNRNKLNEFPALWAYARDLFQTPGCGDRVDFQQIKDHYYTVHKDVNPTGIVPKGPVLTDWLTAHGREDLGVHHLVKAQPPDLFLKANVLTRRTTRYMPNPLRFGAWPNPDFRNLGIRWRFDYMANRPGDRCRLNEGVWQHQRIVVVPINHRRIDIAWCHSGHANAIGCGTHTHTIC